MLKCLLAFLAQFAAYLRPRLIICALLAFSSGFSVLLIVCTVPIWLKDYGISKTVIGWFSLVYLPYILKIFWAPIMDIVQLPWISRWFGHLRGWAVVTQLALLVCTLALAFINPSEHLLLAGVSVALLAFFSASRDTATDAYRVEILDSDEIALGSAMYLFGYRVGMLSSGAGSLLLADLFPWRTTYFILASVLILGLIIIFCIPEPNQQRISSPKIECVAHHQWYQVLARHLRASFGAPIIEFMSRRGWIWIALLIPFYKLGDNFVQSMSNLFFLEIGFSKTDIANAAKIFGLIASIAGSLWGGILVSRIGDLRAMFINGIIHMASFSLFVIQAWVGDSITLLYITIAVTHVTGGIVTTAFVSYISHLCHPSHRITQYALFSSLRSLDKCLTFPAGWLADNTSWSIYFMTTPLLGVPALMILGSMLWGRKMSDSVWGVKTIHKAHHNA